MTASLCPICHAPIPSNAPGGFCAACVLRGAEEAAVLSAGGGPSVEAVQAAFPELEIEGLIGQGGMGFVYKARQASLERTVALKILAPGLSADPAFAERFAREARVLGKLNHPNIVAVHGHGLSGGFYYLIMEYVDGVNLRQAMRAERFTPPQALGVVPGICDALQAAHAQGIWHRDIKPENILLDSRGQVKIVDFGIARLVGDPQRNFTLTVTGTALGSAAYMAPEQHEKPHDVDHLADIYSLGVVIYEMLTGELPLGRFPAPSQRAAVQARIDEIVLRTLEKERSLRQQSAGEVKTDLSRASHLPPSAARRSRHRPSAVAAGLLTIGLLVWAGLRTGTRESPKSGAPVGQTAEPVPEKAVPAETAALPVTPAAPAATVTVTPPLPAAPAVSPQQELFSLFRTMNRLANGQDLAAFQSHSPQRQVLITGDTPLAEKMRNFAGELLQLHLVHQSGERPAPIGFGVMLANADVVALLKDRDGVSAWRQYHFQKKKADWKYINLSTCQWHSTALIEFLPAKGEALTVLRAHLDQSTTAGPEPGSTGQFRIGTAWGGDQQYAPPMAKALLEGKLKSLEDSLKKSGMGESFKVLSPPDLPTEPVHLKEA